MQINLSIKSITIQNIYSQYLSGFFVINRRYQRKLVWDILEKEKFIDSILNGFPIPMIIAANYKKSDGASAYEILDGMQRLNAITSFIEGEFSVGGSYFNLETVAQTKSRKDSGELMQEGPPLEIAACTKILDYPVPFSVFDESEPTKLDESFRRINTGGRTLSKQDVRQAGALGIIPELINEIATYIRKDASHSKIVDLRYMKNISLSNRGLKYGINIHEIFWAKQGIVTHENIRMSRDEETIAHLVSYIADPDFSETTSHYLDSIYKADHENGDRLTQQINRIGKQNIFDYFCLVFGEIRSTLESRGAIFKELVYNGKPSKTSQVFHVVFIAFFKAIINDNLKIVNYGKLCDALCGIFENHLSALDSDRKWTAAERERLSCSVYGVIANNFTPKTEMDRPFGFNVDKLENILNGSKTEQLCYDFKIGMSQLGGDKTGFQSDIVSKIILTLTAMVNTKPGDCFVFVGIADKKSDAEMHEKFYSSLSRSYGGFYITGIDDEAKMFHKSIERLIQKITQLIDNAPISEKFKLTIKSNIYTFTYYDKEVLMFKAFRGDRPELYDGSIYTRSASHNTSVPRHIEFDFYELFKKETEFSLKVS